MGLIINQKKNNIRAKAYSLVPHDVKLKPLFFILNSLNKYKSASAIIYVIEKKIKYIGKLSYVLD